MHVGDAARSCLQCNGLPTSVRGVLVEHLAWGVPYELRTRRESAIAKHHRRAGGHWRAVPGDEGAGRRANLAADCPFCWLWIPPARCVNALPRNLARACGSPCPDDCAVASWSAWSACSVSCRRESGVEARQRRIAKVASVGGAPCPPLTADRRCSGPDLCPIPCKFSEWFSWGVCDGPCNSGDMSRYRNVLDMPIETGAPCPTLTDSRRCATVEACMDCVISDWEPWGSCTSACGSGKRYRARNVTSESQGIGAACPALTGESACNTHKCTVSPTTLRPTLIPTTRSPSPLPVVSPSATPSAPATPMPSSASPLAATFDPTTASALPTSSPSRLPSAIPRTLAPSNGAEGVVYAVLNAPLDELTPTTLARLGISVGFYLSVVTGSVVPSSAITVSIQPGSAIVRVVVAGGSTAGSLLAARCAPSLFGITRSCDTLVFAIRLVSDFRAKLLLSIGQYEILDMRSEQITWEPTLLPTTSVPSRLPTILPTTLGPSQQPAQPTSTPSSKPSFMLTSPPSAAVPAPSGTPSGPQQLPYYASEFVIAGCMQKSRLRKPRRLRVEHQPMSRFRRARQACRRNGAWLRGLAPCPRQACCCRKSRTLVSSSQSRELWIRFAPPLSAL